MTTKTSKRKVLVLASTFPRWKNDTNPPFVYDLSKGLAEKMDVTVLAPHYPGAKDSEQMGKLKVHRFHYFFERFEKLAGNGGMLPTLKANKWYYLTVPFFMLAEIYTTLKLVKKIKPDVIHAHWILPQGLAALTNKIINKTPYVITSHGSDLHSLGFIYLKTVILRNAKHITVVSEYLKNIVETLDKSLISRTDVIPMGVDSKLFNPDKYDEKLKKQYGISGPFLLFVGRLVPEKGIVQLINAMSTVISTNPNAKLIIVGSGTIENQLVELVTKLRLQRHIIFTGEIPHNSLPKYFATADIFVSPSNNEGFGLTLLESLISNTFTIGVQKEQSDHRLPLDIFLKSTTKENTAKAINIGILNFHTIDLVKRKELRKYCNTNDKYSLIISSN